MHYTVFGIEKYAVADITFQGHSKSSETTWFDIRFPIRPND